MDICWSSKSDRESIFYTIFLFSYFLYTDFLAGIVLIEVNDPDARFLVSRGLYFWIKILPP